MARNLVGRIIEHADRPFDEAFMTAAFEAFYRERGWAIYTFNNLLLEPIPDAGKQLLIAQYGSDGTGDDARQRIADAFFANFEDPRRLTATLQDAAKARAFIAESAGGSWIWPVLGGGLRVARAQIRRRLGLEPGHPRSDALASPEPGLSAPP